MKLRKTFAAPLVAGLVVSLAACSQAGTNSPGGTGNESSRPLNSQAINSKARDAVADGGELRLPINELAENWNPMNVAGNEVDYTEVRQVIQPRFFNFDAEGTGTFEKAFLSKEPTVGNDGGKTVVTFHLNPKAVWGDGVKISAKDFEATYKACDGTNEKFECATTEGYEEIESIKQGATADDVVVTYKTTYPDWKNTFSTGPMRAESVADPTVFNTGWTTLTGHDGWFSGPYKVGSYDETSKMVTLVPNDKWWGDKPKLSKVIFRVVPIEAQPQAYANNEIDSFDIGVNADSYARAQQVSTGEIRRAAGPQWRHITLNQDSGLLKDKTIRQAILMALDRGEIGKSDLAGMNWDAKELNSHVFMTGQKQYKDLATETGLKFDREKAKKTLEDAGWKVGSDGFRAKDGQVLEVKFSQLKGVKVSENEAQQFQSQLKEVGIKVTLVDVASKDFSPTLAKRGFESIAFTWVGTPFPYGALNQFFSSKSSSNYSGYNNPAVEETIKKISTEMDPAKRDGYVLDAEKQIWDDVQIIPLYQRPEQYAVNAKVANYGAFGLSNPQWENIGFVK